MTLDAGHQVAMRETSSMRNASVGSLVGVVVAHPDASVRAAFTQALAEVEAKVSVRWFDNGQACLSYLQDQDLPIGEPAPRLVLLAFDLPGLNGMQVLQRLREGRGRRGLPVVMTGTSGDVARVRPAYQAGANSCLLLPDDPLQRSINLTTVVEYWTRVVMGPALEVARG